MKRSPRPVLRHKNTPWNISTTTGWLTSSSSMRPEKFHPDNGSTFCSSGAFCNWNIPHVTLDANHIHGYSLQDLVSLTQTPTSKKSLTTSNTVQQTIHTPQKDENRKLKPSKNNQKTIQQTTLYNKRFTHLKLKQMKTSSKNRLISTKPYKKRFILF